VEQARQLQAERVVDVFLELGVADTELLRIALRSWVAFAEEVLVESAITTGMPSEDIVSFLERSVQAVAASVDQDVGPHRTGHESPPTVE
jgi:hypothetical protein